MKVTLLLCLGLLSLAACGGPQQEALSKADLSWEELETLRLNPGLLVPSTDGSQALVSASGTTNPAHAASGFNKCYVSGDSGPVYTDMRTCKTPQFVYPFWDNTRHCTSPYGSCL